MTTAAKHGLGRGLGALIPQRTNNEGQPNEAGLRQVSVAQIEPNPHQPRRHFKTEALDDLAASIREHGLIQPLLLKEIATPYGARYQLIAGERRWRAAQQAGLQTVAAVIKGATPLQMLELALVENVQRADLNALEEAEAYRQLIEEFQLTQEQVALRVGKNRTTISNSLRLLKMPEALKQAVLDETITEGHARALMSLGDESKQNDALKQVVEHQWSVRQTEEWVRRTLAADGNGNANRHASNVKREAAGEGRHNDEAQARHASDTHALEEELRRALGTKVELYRSQRGGKIIIEFYSDEELDTIYRKLVG